MSRNVEVKARIASVESFSRTVAAIADGGPTGIVQDDTFFACEAGRLKLRALSDDDGELIFYRRADQREPKESFYVRAPTSTPDRLRDVLSLAYGRAGRVRKHRTLYTIGRTRVHLDRVDDLGDFLELEVVLADDEPTDAGVAEAHRLMRRLGVDASDLVDRSYVDLLTARGAASRADRRESAAAIVRRLGVADAPALVALRREALETAPLAFRASLDDDRLLTPGSAAAMLADAEHQAVFAHFDARGLAGMVGLARASRTKERHRGQIWGMYVAARARNVGAGRRLLDAAIEQGRAWDLEQLHLSVTDAAPVAARLYRSAGFRPWGRDTRALQHDGRFVDEHHLVLTLGR